jgi:TPP-dependent trihydroxycyclohexane-1,2-dione (THcHDO) dehydratase
LGHGRLHTEIIFDADQERLVNQNVEHVDSVKDDAIQWLQDAFTAKAELREKKTAAKKKQKGLLADALESDG